MREQWATLATSRQSKAISADLWHLYVLSRVNDYLTMPFQPEHPNPQTSPVLPRITIEAYREF